MTLQNYFKLVRDFVQDHATGIAVVAVTGIGLVKMRKWLAGGVCRSQARLEGKTVLITGANTGIGKETALDLVCRGARVIVACRDLSKANKAAEDIRRASGNGNVVVKCVDLASLKSVRLLVKDIQESEERLDILINNAGVMMCPQWKTEDGFEMQFGVNHLGHFLLTNLLLNLLKKSAPSRIVNVSSLAHEKGHINFDDLNLEKNYSPLRSYQQSKLANVLFSRELATRLEGTGVCVYCVHPGVVLTELMRHQLPSNAVLRSILLLPLLFLFKTSREGAQTTIHCAVDENLAVVSGLYYSDCAPKETAPQAQDEQAARRLWDLSASMVAL